MMILLLGIAERQEKDDERRVYQCIKLVAGLCNQCGLVVDWLNQHPRGWTNAVNWLSGKMAQYCWSPDQSTVSNEDAGAKGFQRTVSAQVTKTDNILIRLEA